MSNYQLVSNLNFEVTVRRTFFEHLFDITSSICKNNMASIDNVYDWDKGHAEDVEYEGKEEILNPFQVKLPMVIYLI